MIQVFVTIAAHEAGPRGSGYEKTAESARTPPFLLDRCLLRTKVIRTATESERPSVGPRSRA